MVGFEIYFMVNGWVYRVFFYVNIDFFLYIFLMCFFKVKVMFIKIIIVWEFFFKWNWGCCERGKMVFVVILEFFRVMVGCGG